MYSKIINPETNRKVSINSKLGKKILTNYLSILKGGASTRSRSGETFKIWQYNILAREYTKYNSKFHSPGSIRTGDKPLEDPNLTKERYTMATDKILEKMPDAICLQECSEAFFSSEFNDSAIPLIKKYDVIPNNEGEPGVCILIKKVPGVVSFNNTVRVGGGDTGRTGGKSKKGVAVLVDISPDKQIWVCCCHLQWEKPRGSKRQANNLLNDLFNEIKRIDPSAISKPFVITGDFNMTPEELPLLSVPVPLVGKDYSHSFQKVDFDDGVSIDDIVDGTETLTASTDSPTGLTGDFSKEVEIDYILYKNLNPPESTQIHLQPKKSVKGVDSMSMSGGPYKVESDGTISIQVPSDHGCMEVVFEL
tara:strand:- start:3764 stop:4855 length:1092 start_codon:yes stop_codon:yes gene_type:complete